MAKGGKRYWFKFYNNFFDNEKVKEIKRRKDGDRLIVIFINCLAIAANCESGGYFCRIGGNFAETSDLSMRIL